MKGKSEEMYASTALVTDNDSTRIGRSWLETLGVVSLVWLHKNYGILMHSWNQLRQ